MGLRIASVVLGFSALLFATGFYTEPAHIELHFWANILGSFLYLMAALILLFSKTTIKQKILWTIVFLAVWPFLLLVSSYITKKGYQHFYNKNEAQLTEIVGLLAGQNQNVIMTYDGVEFSLSTSVDIDSVRLKALAEDLKLSGLYKMECSIFFETWGMLDNRRGIHYKLKNAPECYDPPKIAWLNDSWYCPIRNY